MRQAGKAVERLFDDLRPKPQRAHSGIGAAGILVVMRAGKPLDAAQVDRADLPRLAILRQEPLAREDRPARSGQLAVDRHPDHPIVARSLGQLPGQEPPFGLVHADHRAVGPTLGEKPALGGEIAAHAAVPVQVIRGQVGEDRDVRGQRAGKLGLVARQLQHHHPALARRVDVQHAAPDVARKLAVAPRLGQDVMDQRRRGRLAVRAGHRDHPRRRLEPLPTPTARASGRKDRCRCPPARPPPGPPRPRGWARDKDAECPATRSAPPLPPRRRRG